MSSPDLFPYPVSRLGQADAGLALTLGDLLSKEVIDKRLELKEDYEKLLRPALKKTFLDIGLQKMFWPEKLGGEGHNKPAAAYTITSALEQIGKADTGLAFLAAHNLALQAALALEGNRQEDACAAFAPRFVEGDQPVIVSFVLPTFGEDEEAPQWRGKYPQLKAEEAKDGWVLNGREVRPTCSGADADLFAVVCAVDGDEGPVVILVPGDARGLKRSPEFKKTGLAASRMAELTFTKVKAPTANCALRGDEGLRRLLSWYYLGLAAAGSGALLACHDIIKEWGNTRVIKGRGHIFKENPLTAALMGETAKETAVDRLLAYDLAGILAEPDTYGDSGSEGVFVIATMIDHHIFASAEYTIHRIMELMASAGYAKEWQLERYWRDVKALQCYLGAAELAKHDYARCFYQTRTL